MGLSHVTRARKYFVDNRPAQGSLHILKILCFRLVDPSHSSGIRLVGRPVELSLVASSRNYLFAGLIQSAPIDIANAA